MNSSKDVVFAITEEIGTDISYLRQKHGKEEAAYFTGIEIGVLFGGTILATFLIGMLKGAFAELTGAAGKQLGKSLAGKLIKKLTPIAEQTQFKETNTEQLLELAVKHQKELDALRRTIAGKLTSEVFEQLVETSVTYEREQITIHLQRNGFTNEKAAIQSERLVRRIQQELKTE
ncbi:MAG TPA: hypothetical protein VGJ30_12680 [Candidatus Angelobacter sp.]|jgi:hypothetical protein